MSIQIPCYFKKRVGIIRCEENEYFKFEVLIHAGMLKRRYFLSDKLVRFSL